MEVLAQPETVDFDREQRLHDDTTTWLAEVLDGNMRSGVEFYFDGQELYGRDGSPLKKIFQDAITHADVIAEKEPELKFELRRRWLEAGEYRDMVSMAKGEAPNTMVVISDFPPELEHAREDMGGYNAKRKQTMMRVITRETDGRIRMYCQSLDRSDRAGLEAIYHSLGSEPAQGELLGQRMQLELETEQQEFLTDRLMGVYDRELETKYGGQWYAGRRDDHPVNTYEFVCRQKDLLSAFAQSVDHISENEQLLYNLAAACQARFKNIAPRAIAALAIAEPAHNPLMEMQLAGMQARNDGKTFSGCGASIKAEGGPHSTTDQLSEAGIGNKTADDKENWTWKQGVCRVEKCKTRPGKTEIGPCSVCRRCQAKFDAGKDPTK